MILLATLFENIVTGFFVLLGIYTLIGFIFSIFFVLKGAEKIDDAAKNTSIGFKLLIIPGSIAFWPLLLKKWKK